MKGFRGKRVTCGWMAAFAFAVAPMALAAPIAFPGGQVDSERLDQGEIYLAEPQAAVAPPGCEVAERYMTDVRTGQFDKVAALFTPDAVIFHNGGAALRGAAEIADFYGRRVRQAGPKPLPVAYGLAPGMCMVQVAVSRDVPGVKPVHFAGGFDEFILAPDGRVKMLIAYGRKTPIVANEMRGMREDK